MKKILNKFLQKLTFRHQLGIMITLGILLLALCSSPVSYTHLTLPTNREV